MSNNIFDTRNIIKETPKVGNRFLLTANPTRLNSIILNSPLYKLLCSTSTPPQVAQVFGGVMSGDMVETSMSQVLDLSLLSCTIPSFEFESTELNHFNDTVKHLSKFSTINDMSATFYDYINGSSTMIMLAWQSRVGFKLTGEMGYKDDYVCDMDLHLYGPNRPGVILEDENYSSGSLTQYKILNAWPRSVEVGDFSYDGAEIKKVTVQFSYDVIVPFRISGEADAGDGLSLKEFSHLSSDVNNSANTATGATGATNNIPGTVGLNQAGTSSDNQTTLGTNGSNLFGVSF
jgi:hypothetical protein